MEPILFHIHNFVIMLESDHCPKGADESLGSGVFSSERRPYNAGDWSGEGCLPPDDCQAILETVRERVERGEISTKDRLMYAEQAEEYLKGHAIVGDVFRQICEVLKVKKGDEGFVIM